MSAPVRRIIEHYPVDRLPDDLRPDLPGAAHVTVSVTVTEEPFSVDPAPKSAPKYLRLWAAAADKDTSIAEAVTRIRKLRDEW